MTDYKAIFRDKGICVIVPTYNNAATLAPLLNDLAEYTEQIIVINDGSTDHTSGILSEFQALEIVSYPQNRGKGYALRQGLAMAYSLGYRFAISIDSDGQHFASDLPRFLKVLEGNEGSIIMGVRNMNQMAVPGKSNFGRKFSNFWFEVETGLRLKDTQSGYRLYPVKELHGIRFVTNKFEFEIEVLVRSAWEGIPITEVPVKVYYAEKDKRVSHFRPFRDFTRISVLNTVLVALALLYYRPRNLFRQLKKKRPGNLSGASFSTPVTPMQ